MGVTYIETERRPVEEWLAAVIYNTKQQLRSAEEDLRKATVQVEKANDEIKVFEQRLADFRVAQEELGFLTEVADV